ncbi:MULTISPECIES: transposase, partial [unclassified Bacillus (in: firmicutes)]|uniref:transposase n=1 Tax=unclassified Bacillus (in: firmicutes) TaxID=185979 RepID=UPI0030105FDD
ISFLNCFPLKYRICDSPRTFFLECKLLCNGTEQSFADAKELHGYRYARFRGLKSVKMQAYLTGACQNMKKIALH